MRVTKKKIENEIQLEIKKLVNDNVKGVKDFTIANDFAQDLYSSFESDNRYSNFKSYWQLFMDLKHLFVHLQIGRLKQSLDFYNDSKEWQKNFIKTNLFRELSRLDPMEALEIILKMFKPPQMQGGNGDKNDDQKQKQQQNKDNGKDNQQKSDDDNSESSERIKQENSQEIQNQKSQDGDNGQDQQKTDKQNEQGSDKNKEDSYDNDDQQSEQSGKKPAEGSEGQSDGENQQPTNGTEQGQQELDDMEIDSQDQQGSSADSGSMPIDMDKFNQKMSNIEKVIDSGILDQEDMKEILGQKAGMDSKEITLHNIDKWIDKISKMLGNKDLIIFDIARKKDLTEVYKRDEIKTSIPYPENEIDVKQIDTVSEVLRIFPSQYALDDDMFYSKLVKNDLIVRDYQERRKKKQVLYLLIDVSGSMDHSITNNIKTSHYAAGVGLSFIRQAIKEGSTYFLRFFDYSTKQLYKIKTQEEANIMANILLKQPFSGGGTSIQNAIQVAVNDITTDPEGFEKAEIMLITDGEDRVDIDKSFLKNIHLHTTIIGQDNTGLKRLSKTYTKLTGQDINDFTK